MPLRIVHLSDLHYPSIDPTMWGAVKQATLQRNPHLIIVSGDLVDGPIPYNLQLVQTELNALARQAGASLHVVAGNHDVFPSGLNTVVRRSDAFEQTFRIGDGGVVAPVAVAPAMPVAAAKPLGMLQRFLHLLRPYQPPPAAAPAIVEPSVRSLICQPERMPVPVLLALFDSNPNDARLAFAAGEVAPNDLVAVETALNKKLKPHLLRIAVIHHHVLPIAFSNGTVKGNESLMVLRNAADLLKLLARHRFDLVLHGHKHLSQFVRLDFSPTDAEGYPIAVAAAGAAALIEQKNQTDSCGFNFIDVDDNGRITVTSFSYGYGTAPVLDKIVGTAGKDYRTYEESVATVARRAFWRAIQQHKTRCDSRICSFEVTESGDLVVDNWLSGLRHTAPEPDVVIRRHMVGIAPHAWLAVPPTLDSASAGRRCTVTEAAPEAGRRHFLVQIPRDNVTGSEGGRYHLHHEVANSVTMSDWEDHERRRVQPPQDGRPAGQEWVSVLVNYPVETLEIRLKLPSEFEREQPSIRCERMVDLADYAIDPQGDSVKLSEDAQPAPDGALTEHVAQGLTWLAGEGRWQLRIRHPMVGYRYDVYWKLRDDPVPTSIRNDTRGWRRTLLRLEQQLRSGRPSASGPAAQQVFDELTGNLVTMLSGAIPDHRYAATLFVYDEAELALRPVLSRKSWDKTSVRHDFHVPLGDGLAGAAFQQRRTIAWANVPEQSPLVRPKQYPYEPNEDEGPEHAIVAIPVYYDPGVRPLSPWNAIGVVSYSSWGELSKIPTMGDAPASAFAATVSGFTQAQFNRLRASVVRGQVAP